MGEKPPSFVGWEGYTTGQAPRGEGEEMAQGPEGRPLGAGEGQEKTFLVFYYWILGGRYCFVDFSANRRAATRLLFFSIFCKAFEA